MPLYTHLSFHLFYLFIYFSSSKFTYTHLFNFYRLIQDRFFNYTLTYIFFLFGQAICKLPNYKEVYIYKLDVFMNKMLTKLLTETALRNEAVDKLMKFSLPFGARRGYVFVPVDFASLSKAVQHITECSTYRYHQFKSELAMKFLADTSWASMSYSKIFHKLRVQMQ